MNNYIEMIKPIKILGKPIDITDHRDGKENIGKMTSMTDENGTRYYKCISERYSTIRLKNLNDGTYKAKSYFPSGYYVKEYEFAFIRSEIVAVDSLENDKECTIRDIYELKEMDKKPIYLKNVLPKNTTNESVPIEKRIKYIDRKEI